MFGYSLRYRGDFQMKLTLKITAQDQHFSIDIDTSVANCVTTQFQPILVMEENKVLRALYAPLTIEVVEHREITKDEN